MLPESPQSPIDPLIGRTRDLVAVEAALAGGRLVTITGLGGAGKTRLAREILRRALARGGRGWFVDLAHVTDAAGVPDAIAAALDVGESAEVALAAAIALEIGRSESLLVLDNLEQVVGARRFIADLVGEAPRSRVLGTSRLRLGVQGEVVMTLDPLQLPASAEDLERSGASRLFLARARQRGGLGSMTDEDRRAVVEVCRRLDGLPLALELGAAWTRLLRPPAILRRLEAGRLTLSGDDDHERRHVSLEAVVDSTLGLVTAEDRAVFEALATFAGGFDEPATAAVTEVPDALSSLRRLEEVGLVRVVGERDGEPRFALLETIRAAAAASLAAHGGEALVRRRHAEWFASWAEPRVEALRRVGDSASRAAFDAETPNLRVAHAFAVDAGDASLALRLATAMGVVGRRSPGSLREHIARLEHSLAMGEVPARVRCEGLNALAWLVDDVPVDSTSVETLTAEALRLAESLEDPLLLARTLITRATVAVPSDAVALLERAAEIATRHELPFEAASAYNNAADVLGREGRLEEARALSAPGPGGERGQWRSIRSRPRFGEPGRDRREPRPVRRRGRVSPGGDRGAHGRLVGDPPRPLAGPPCGRRVAAWSLGRCVSQPRPQRGTCRGFRRPQRDRHLPQRCRDRAPSRAPDHRPPRIGRRSKCRRTTATLLGQPLLEAAEASAVAAIGAAKVERALAAGAAATARAVFDEVRAVLEERGLGVGPASDRVRGSFGQLTDREMDVLRLLAEARSDGEIAEALAISPKTSSVHVANIKSKLGVETRMEAALSAREPARGRSGATTRSITDRSLSVGRRRLWPVASAKGARARAQTRRLGP